MALHPLHSSETQAEHRTAPSVFPFKWAAVVAKGPHQNPPHPHFIQKGYLRVVVSMLERPLEYQTAHSMASAGHEVRGVCHLGALLAVRTLSYEVHKSHGSPVPALGLSPTEGLLSLHHSKHKLLIAVSCGAGSATPTLLHLLSPPPDLETRRPVITAIVTSFPNR